MILTPQVSPLDQLLISGIADRIRNLRGNSPEINILSTSINRNIKDLSDNLYGILTKELPAEVKREVQNYRLYLRKIEDINAQSYSERQRFHTNYSTSRNVGEGYLQFIYFIETPKRKGRNAPESNRGILLLKGENNTVPRRIVPKKGKLVFFTPNDTPHEVAYQNNRNMGSVSRDMIIGFLYKVPTRNNTVNRQIRVNSPRARVLRALANQTPLNSRSGPYPPTNTLLTGFRKLNVKNVKKPGPKPGRTPIKKQRTKTPTSTRSKKRNDKLKSARSK